MNTQKHIPVESNAKNGVSNRKRSDVCFSHQKQWEEELDRKD